MAFSRCIPQLTLLTAMLAVPAANAASITLKSDQWKLAAIPSLYTTTVGTEFDELPPNNYGKTWIVFTFDGTRYNQPDLDEPIVPGTGFWITQITGSDVEIEFGSKPVSNSESGSGNEPVANNESTSKNEPVTNNESGSSNEPVANNESGSSNEPVANNESGSSNEPVANNESGSNSQPVSNNASVAYDSNLPMGGLFYGNHQSGLHTGNAQIGIENSRRFRAEKTGSVAAMGYQNRIIEASELYRWKSCSGLDVYECGYTLNNHYAVGNGGSIQVELRPDDNGVPSKQVLGRTAGRFVPMDNPNGPAELTFEQPVSIQAGKIYHLVYTNSNPPTGACAKWPVSASQAVNCPRDQGAHGLNGVFFGPHGGDGPRYGPFRGSADATLSRRYADSKWEADPDSQSWYRLVYTDGVETGDTVLAHGSYEAPQLQIVQGSKQVRQVFTVRDANRNVDGVWLSYGHLAGSNPSGAPLSVSVKNEAGDVLATGSLPYSKGCASKPNTSNIFEKFCQDWHYTALNSVVPLEQGNTYSIEFSAPESAAFAMGVTFPGIYSPIASKSRTHWNDAHAQLSSNGGSSWSSWSSGYQGERDMALVFTLDGGKRKLD